MFDRGNKDIRSLRSFSLYSKKEKKKKEKRGKKKGENEKGKKEAKRYSATRVFVVQAISSPLLEREKGARTGEV